MITKDLHKSISEMSENEIITHIREIRALRRQIPERSIRKAKGSKTPTVRDHLKKLSDTDRKILLERLLKLKEK